MAWMIVTKEINYRRPNGPFFHIRPANEPQIYPHDVVEYALREGFAKRASSPNAKMARKKKP